ncbi:deoxyribonuclease-1 [Amphritea atlantica]|uniref:Deoxyribonuclease-1 n=1 Tax=Amphritea atlantica TaxID=355243 RepID=A0A1H9DLA3_9GAMM|nr:endonuclease I family protein [Amphritea atlantica]SEQ14199.1 deoxyribonuclease-1 [Amphritea atlantica]
MPNRFLITLFLLLLSGLTLAESAASFSKSKRLLAGVYQVNPVSFYCGCDYRSEGKKLVPEWGRCGFQPRKNGNRAARIEWEHIVPAWAFGHQLQCWQNGGRKACKKDERFKQMEADMHNLVPAIGEVNGDRSNYSFTQLEGEPRVYGRCDMEVDFKRRKVEPPQNRQGDIARTYFYMRDRYGLKISSKQEKLFAAWSVQDPVDSWELQRNELIAGLQGNSNPYVTAPAGVIGAQDTSTPVGSDSSNEAEDTLIQRLLTKLRQQ